MRPPKNNWPTSAEGRNVLLCAQLFREMLGELAFESFRVYSLDTISRLDESLALIQDVQRSRTNSAQMEYRDVYRLMSVS